MSWDQNQYDEGYGQYEADRNGQVPAGGGFYNPNMYDPYYGGGASPAAGPPVPGQYGQSPQPYGGHQQMPPPQYSSQGYGVPPPTQDKFLIPGAGVLQDPMVTNLAMTYGRDFVGKGQEEIKKNFGKYVSIGQLKYYFAVDNSYVSKKLGLLLFPFVHKDWSIRYNHDEPVQPRLELNAADLYIPSMGFVTYILVAGYLLGLQQRFSPEILATTASSALTSLILEILVVYLITTVMSITSTLSKWDYLAFSMYKYVAMIACLVGGLLLSTSGYYATLLYTSLALALFLFRTLHLRVEPEVHGVENHGKRKLWLLFVMVAWQPIMMWWLTHSLVPAAVQLPTGPAEGAMGGEI